MATPPAEPAAPARTCEVRGWRVFGPGYHRGDLYSPARVRRIAENFARLYPRLSPTAKVGHSNDQEVADRARESLGFASLGDVTGVRATPDGTLVLDVANVPASLGAAINAGRYRGGSIEVLPFVLDPDTGEKVDGPVLTGVAFLGEEQPAVKGFAPPRAVWPDGSPVPADPEPAAWLTAMADALKTYAARSRPCRPGVVRFGGREYAAQTLCFSEVIPVRDAIHKRLMAHGCDPAKYSQFSDDQLAGVADDLDAVKKKYTVGDGSANQDGQKGAMEFFDEWDRPSKRNHSDVPAAPLTPAMPPAPVTPPPAGAMGDLTVTHEDDDEVPADAPPYVKAMAAKYAALTKRMAAVEAAKEDEQKKADAAQAAAFSQQVDAVLERNRARLTTAERAAKMASGLDVLKATYSAAADRTKAFSDWVRSIESLPEIHHMYRDTIPDGEPGARELTPGGRGVLAHLAVTNPRVVERLTAAK